MTRGTRTQLAVNLRYWERAPGVLRYRMERGRIVGDLGRLYDHIQASAGVRLSDPIAALRWVVDLGRLAYEFDNGSMRCPPEWSARIVRNLALGGFSANDYVDRRENPPVAPHDLAKWAVGGVMINLPKFGTFDLIDFDAQRALRSLGLLPDERASRAKIRNPEKKVRAWLARYDAEEARRWSPATPNTTDPEAPWQTVTPPKSKKAPYARP